MNDYSALKSNCGGVGPNMWQDQIPDEKVNAECYKNITPHEVFVGAPCLRILVLERLYYRS